MNFQGIEICCPRCQGDLRSTQAGDGEQLRCDACDHDYPVIAGIPDLRVFPDPYIDFEPDRAKGLKVASHLDDLDFPKLVEFYYSMTEVVPPQHAKLYSRGLMAAFPRAQATLDCWLAAANRDERPVSTDTFLDLGCGTGPLLAAAAPHYKKVVGVDIAFRWLVVARKRLAERGINAPLICACAEAMPFRDGVFDTIAAESVIEHVKDQSETLSQCHRVLAPGGRLFLSTPNRFSLGPDPQTGIWVGSWLPDRIVAALVRRQGGIPPKRRLLSARGLRRLVTAAGFDNTKITVPDISPQQRAHFPAPLRLIIDLYRLALAMPGTRQLLCLIGPLLLAVSKKPSHSHPPK